MRAEEDKSAIRRRPACGAQTERPIVFHEGSHRHSRCVWLTHKLLLCRGDLERAQTDGLSRARHIISGQHRKARLPPSLAVAWLLARAALKITLTPELRCLVTIWQAGLLAAGRCRAGRLSPLHVSASPITLCYTPHHHTTISSDVLSHFASYARRRRDDTSPDATDQQNDQQHVHHLLARWRTLWCGRRMPWGLRCAWLEAAHQRSGQDSELVDSCTLSGMPCLYCASKTVLANFSVL